MKNILYYAWLLALFITVNAAFTQQPQSPLWSLPSQQYDFPNGQFSPLPTQGYV